MATHELLSPQTRTRVRPASIPVRHDVRDAGARGGVFQPLDALPSAAAVPARGDVGWLFLCGQTPSPVDRSAPPGTRVRFGDMETQTRDVLRQLRARLRDAGFDFGDVVKATTYLVGEGERGDVDVAGFDRAWREAFPFPGTPAHSRLQVPQLLDRGWRVQVEVLAAREIEREHHYRQPSKSLRPSSVLCLDQG